MTTKAIRLCNGINHVDLTAVDFYVRVITPFDMASSGDSQ
jgi:hypothetical protein